MGMQAHAMWKDPWGAGAGITPWGRGMRPSERAVGPGPDPMTGPAKVATRRSHTTGEARGAADETGEALRAALACANDKLYRRSSAAMTSSTRDPSARPRDSPTTPNPTSYLTDTDGSGDLQPFAAVALPLFAEAADKIAAYARKRGHAVQTIWLCSRRKTLQQAMPVHATPTCPSRCTTAAQTRGTCTLPKSVS